MEPRTEVDPANNGILETGDFVGACPLLVLFALMAVFGGRYYRHGRYHVRYESAFERANRQFEEDFPEDSRTGWEEPPDDSRGDHRR